MYKPFRWTMLGVGVVAIAAAVTLAVASLPATRSATTKVTNVAGKVTTEATNEKAHGRASSDVVIAILSAGLLSVIAGAFSDRVTKLQGPGIDLELSPATQATLAAHIAAKEIDDPEKARQAYLVAYRELAKRKPPTEAQVQRAVNAAVRPS